MNWPRGSILLLSSSLSSQSGRALRILFLSLEVLLAQLVGPLPRSHITATGAGIGTPAYVAPEQSRDMRDVDCRADINDA